jgi:hypothetical protein
MNAAQQELFDLAVLRVLDANRTHYGLTLAALAHLLAEFGFSSPPKDLVSERLEVLTRKGFVEEVSKLLGAANRAWRITEKGIGYTDDRA